MSDYTGSSAVVIVDIQMPFGSMVVFMVKWAIASIPAMLILGLIGLVLSVFLAVATGIGGSLFL